METRVCALVLVVGLLLAAQPSLADSERLRPDRTEPSLAQLRAIRSWKLTVNLKLDQMAAARIFPVLDGFDDRIRDNWQQSKQIARDIEAESLAAQPNDDRLGVLVARHRANLANRQEIDRERWEAVRPILSTLQQLQMLWLLPRLEQKSPQRLPRGPNLGHGPR